MYQRCTSTTVNSGQQRAVTVTRKPTVSRPIAALPGTGETFGPGLITRRSQVQILPPPPRGPGQTPRLTRAVSRPDRRYRPATAITGSGLRLGAL